MAPNLFGRVSTQSITKDEQDQNPLVRLDTTPTPLSGQGKPIDKETSDALQAMRMVEKYEKQMGEMGQVSQYKVKNETSAIQNSVLMLLQSETFKNKKYQSKW